MSRTDAISDSLLFRHPAQNHMLPIVRLQFRTKESGGRKLILTLKAAEPSTPFCCTRQRWEGKGRASAKPRSSREFYSWEGTGTIQAKAAQYFRLPGRLAEPKRFEVFLGPGVGALGPFTGSSCRPATFHQGGCLGSRYRIGRSLDECGEFGGSVPGNAAGRSGNTDHRLGPSVRIKGAGRYATDTWFIFFAVDGIAAGPNLGDFLFEPVHRCNRPRGQELQCPMRHRFPQFLIRKGRQPGFSQARAIQEGPPALVPTGVKQIRGFDGGDN